MPSGPGKPTPDFTPEDRCALVTDHWPVVFRVLHRLCGNPHDAEELTQEAFLRALQKLDQFKPGSNMRGWLVRIATNAFLDSKRRRRAESIEEANLVVPAPGDPAGGALERDESMQVIQRALLELTDTQRAVFLLRTLEDMSFVEISAAVGTSEVTARWHMLQARQQLLKKLGGKV